MSVLAIIKVQGDTAKFRQALTDRADEFAKSGEQARGVGALHHRFGIGDGYVVAVDEWETVAEFQKFFADPSLQEFIASIGGETATPPEITITEAVSSADQF
jgi:quinol monooxygenase YgiN